MNARRKPKWSPPKPSIKECILDLVALFKPDGSFSTPEFQGSVANSFLKTGCFHEDNQFRLYEVTASAGTLPIAPTGTIDMYAQNDNLVSADEILESYYNDVVDSDDEDTDDEDED